VSVGRGPAAVVVAEGAVWVANALDDTVSRVDPVAAVVRATVPVGQGPTALAAGLGGVWVGHEGDGTVWRIDPATGAVARPLPLGGPVAGLGAGAGALFVSALPARRPHRGGTLRVLFGAHAIESVDPASAYDPVSLSVLRLTHDGLTAFERVAASGGAQLVPNLATSLPKPADAARTYTFRVRDGIRYATGDPVRPADFRRGLERVFSSRSGAASLYTALEGARACVRRPRRCDLSAGVAADARAATVTFHLTKPDPELPNKLALPPAAPVPRAALSRASRGRPVTGTGTYKIASYVPGRQLKLVRNPHFREWSRAARPAGYPDEIVFALGVSDARQLRDVARGDADVAYFPPAEKLAPLRSRYATRLHTNPGPTLWYLGLNTHVRPFDDVRVRRALNYAVDRRMVARLSGGAFGAQPTCQIMPLGLPGHRPYCPYHHDLGRAKRLVAASGTRGARVVVWSSPRSLAWMSPVISALRQLGYQAHIRFAGDDEPSIAVRSRGVVIQAAQQARAADYPGASTMVQPFTCRAMTPNLPSFCDRAIDRAIDRALKLQLSDPHTAGDLWARIDWMIVDRAAAVPLANPRRVDFLSKRVGNYQYHPLWGMLLDQLWVR
jgi:peptide/nickel transport system substrate-binding protein